MTDDALPDAREWARLTAVPEKHAFATDIYFREGWADVRDTFGEGSADALHSFALLSFKPDAVVGRRLRPTLDFVVENGFVPVATAPIIGSRHSMRELWRYNWDVYTIDRLAMSTWLYTATEMLLLMLYDPSARDGLPASVRLSDLKGPSDPDARTERHLRFRLRPPNRINNFVHIADEPVDIARELGILLDRPVRRALLADLREGPRDGAHAGVLEAFASLERRYPEHDLQAGASLRRLEESGALTADGAARLRAAMRGGAPIGWDELTALADPGAVDRWDFLCVAIAVLPEERPGARDLLPSAGVAAWRRREAAGDADPRLAVTTYASGVSLDDREDVLSLSWTLDERECLAADVLGVVTEELRREAGDDLPWVRRYLVTDPYGEAALGPAVAAYFARPGWAPALTCAAGVGPLVAAAAGVARRGAYVVGPVYPDLPYWVARSGGTCVPGDAGGTVEEHAAKALASGVSVVFLERPALHRHRLHDLAQVRALCERLAGSDVVVVVDESNANYREPAFSAAPLVGDVPNLAVLRGLSKAYGLGGLRLGFAVASPAATTALRAALPPLQASSLSLRAGAAVLGLGDVTAPLRARIAESKEETAALLAAAGIHGLVPADGGLPYLLGEDERADARHALAARGVATKVHVSWQDGHERRLLRLSVPLRAERMESLRRRLAGVSASRP